jgi:hypothetical protein
MPGVAGWGKGPIPENSYFQKPPPLASNSQAQTLIGRSFFRAENPNPANLTNGRDEPMGDVRS